MDQGNGWQRQSQTTGVQNRFAIVKFNYMDKETNESAKKKKYEKPEVISEKIFELNALTCGKCVNSHSIILSGACARGAPKTS
jgi:hypothetical protein